MKGLWTKDWEFMRGNRNIFLAVYVIALVCFLTISAGPSFLISYVSILAAVMALNVISNDTLNNGIAYLLTFPVSRREYVQEKYLFGTIVIVVMWLLSVLIGSVVNVSGFRPVSGEEMVYSAIAGIGVALLAEAIMFPVQLKYGSEMGRIVLFVVVFGIMGLSLLGKELCTQLDLDVTPALEFFGRILDLGPFVLAGIAAVLLLLILVISCTISVKIMEKKEY